MSLFASLLCSLLSHLFPPNNALLCHLPPCLRFHTFGSLVVRVTPSISLMNFMTEFCKHCCVPAVFCIISYEVVIATCFVDIELLHFGAFISGLAFCRDTLGFPRSVEVRVFLLNIDFWGHHSFIEHFWRFVVQLCFVVCWRVWASVTRNRMNYMIAFINLAYNLFRHDWYLTLRFRFCLLIRHRT